MAARAMYQAHARWGGARERKEEEGRRKREGRKGGKEKSIGK